jgi:multidrug transporter EmrE-like cation transporter
MDKKWIAFALTIGGVTLEIFGDVLLKKWSLETERTLLVSGVFLYAIGSILWIWSLRFDELSKLGPLFTILNAIGLALIGTIYFKEHLSNIQKTGVLLGIASIFLLEW